MKSHPKSPESKSQLGLEPNQVWQGDLSYVRVIGNFVYVACVLDSFTRDIVGWSIAERLTAEVALEALD